MRRLVTVTLALLLASPLPAAAQGNLTLPFADPHPRITSWVDHHYPTREQDGIMIRFDGATGYAYDGHRGTDFAIPSNTPVVAADDGTVIYSEWSDSGGWGVVIDHADDRTAYFHNNRLFVYPGQHVSRGQLISLSGSTGNSTGPHLHFEVRDRLTPWHSIDPFGWTGPGPDPWRWDMGYLWSSNPPTAFVLPLAFLNGARWDYWYGSDGAPPPVSWRIADGGRGLAGYAARWDADPGVQAARTFSASGTISVPGTGAHTLHLRVFDRAGQSADITYLYLYDTDPPSAQLTVHPAASSAFPVLWSGIDTLSGIGDVTVEVAEGAGAPLRLWVAETVDQPAAGVTNGALRFFGKPGTPYRFRLTVRDQARNAGTPQVAEWSSPPRASLPPSAADAALLGPLPELAAGAPSPQGVTAEHPSGKGSVLLTTTGSLVGLGGLPPPASAAAASSAPAIDVADGPGGRLRLFADGSTWTADGTPGPRFSSVPSPVRLLTASDGTAIAVGAQGSLSTGQAPSTSLSPGATVIDAGLFEGRRGGLILDSAGGVEAFGGGDPALIGLPGVWTLTGKPAGIVVSGTPEAAAGLLIDANGSREAFGSLLLLPELDFSGPTFDPETGLVVR